MPPPKPPTKIGPYRIVGQIGEGGMGVVYEAIQQPIDRRVAIKVLLARYAHDRELLTRFFNGMRQAEPRRKGAERRDWEGLRKSFWEPVRPSAA